MLRRRRMLPASLIERHLGTRQHKRASAAFYLSWAREGRTRMRHVPSGKVDRVRRLVESWQEWRALVRRWFKLTDQIGALLRQLGDGQAEDPEEFRP